MNRQQRFPMTVPLHAKSSDIVFKVLYNMVVILILTSKYSDYVIINGVRLGILIMKTKKIHKESHWYNLMISLLHHIAAFPVVWCLYWQSVSV